ncbi:bifunctional (p)ppGpp synthetase/guanosine-3',5'-bis(diphosphate) 3'-pyrophosphohydrolase [Ancylomarina sp. 16SWW S1-10-2]|uniref:RelA/SpoT family protein n=1 Tax=Ancylomarina sp. 16SWW S1-10-2 TaxID=2499681 RepID=UPI0012AD5F5D|nr:RelA/SpoT family protein [Ancylomarina sp. 16SWW S1-10-2]MRT92857.1 bifunctional (p)ppGpp synthetase/guanosine-3',5'-bis(diphosphate) 3'-pyrophosphohydrolase [Ancylomarina sp. 16SWW S1-10-2]
MVAITQQEEETRHILSRYKKLLKSCKNIISRDDIKLVRKAFDLSLLDHDGERRTNGEPATYKTLGIAEIVVDELGLGRTSVICSMLYDIVQKKGISVDEVNTMFGPKVTQIIEGLVKVTEIYKLNPTLHTENFRKLLLSFADDVRVVLIILADRLFQLRSAENKSSEIQISLAKEINFLYIPLAHRLGMYQVKSSMEDLALRYLEPEIYFELEKKLKDTEEDRAVYIKNFVAPIREELDRLGIKYSIKARTKSIASILHKMKKQQVEFEEVYDIFAIRIIIEAPEKREKSECWQVYSAVSDLYRPNPKRMRDWITIPKTNGYESLHTTVMGLQNRWVEVQIRSERMNNIAENGFAAHWRYKGDKGDGGLDNWLQDVREVLESEENSNIDLIDHFKADLYSKEIYVFTPKGDLKQLKSGSTLLDFAYSIHSDLGDKCIGGTVNQRNVSIRQVLNNGDRVSITTSNSQKPKSDWLAFVVTTKAKNKIRQTVNEEKVKEAEIGKETLMRRMKNWKIEFSDVNIRKLLSHYKYKLASELYYNIAIETHDLSEIKDVITYEKEVVTEAFVPKKETPKTIEHAGEDVLIIDENIANVDYTLSKCCNPIFGDDIFGFISIGKGIRIHRVSCPNANEMMTRYPYRVVKSTWSAKGSASYQAVIHITGEDELGMVNNITELISKDLRVKMRAIQVETNAGSFEGRLTVVVSNIDHLNNLIAKLKLIKGVSKVSRYDNVV